MTEQTLDASLIGIEFEPRQLSWRTNDVMLYALGVGSKPATELDFLYEGRGPKVLPTYGVIPGIKTFYYDEAKSDPILIAELSRRTVLDNQDESDWIWSTTAKKAMPLVAGIE